MCPIFQISNVTGENLDLLKMFLNLLSPRTSYREEEPAEFQIDDTYSVPVRGSRASRVAGWTGTAHGGVGLGAWWPGAAWGWTYWAGVFPAGCGHGGVGDNTQGPDQAERHAAAGPGPSGQLPVHRGEIHPPQAHARQGGARGPDGLLCAEEGEC